MRQRSLRLTIALLVLAVIALISAVPNGTDQPPCYMEKQQKWEADSLAQNISSQYGAHEDGWNIDYIHGMCLYVLDDGFIIKLYDQERNVLWDAENYDITLCRDMMQSISVRMQEEHPDLEGNFAIFSYELKRRETSLDTWTSAITAPSPWAKMAFSSLKR